MKHTKLALSVLILSGILFFASCSNDNSVESQSTGVTDGFSATFLIESSYSVPAINQGETIERSRLMAFLKESKELAAPEFVKCNGESMSKMLSDNDSEGIYQYSTPHYTPDFNVEIGGYLGGTLAFTTSNNIIRFTNITAGDTLNQNNFEIGYAGADPNTYLFIAIRTQLGKVVKRIDVPTSAGTIAFTAEELSQVGGETTVTFLQDRCEFGTYQSKPVLKRLVTNSTAAFYVTY